jgi:hypothetical protein
MIETHRLVASVLSYVIYFSVFNIFSYEYLSSYNPENK